MSGLRGRAILYPLLLLSSWVVGRTAYLNWEPAPSAAAATGLNGQQEKRALASEPDDPPTSLSSAHPRAIFRTQINHGQRSARPLKPLLQDHNNPVLLQPLPFQLPLAADAHSDEIRPPGALRAAADIQQGNRWFGYGYSFWRVGNDAGSVVAPAGQYGGSQSGIILGYDLGGARDKGLAVVTRAVATPSRGGDEVALGLRWQRPTSLPISLNAERRFVLNGRDRWAVYAAGGVDAVPLPARFTLDAYGQAGWASGGGGGFFDAQSRATRKLAASRGVTFKAGAGAWAGGQQGVQRLDVGPTLAGEFAIGETKLDLRLDWRQRLAGNATPRNGVALTLSGGF